MRDYGKVYTAFWTSDDARSFTEDGRMLALYLMTCPHGNMLGCFRLPNAYAADDLNWDIERVSKGFEELFRKGYAYRCKQSFWVVIQRYLKWNQFENPNVGKAAGKLFDSISPPSIVRALLVKALRDFSPTFPSQKLADFETLSIPFQDPFDLISKTVVGAVAVTTAIATTEIHTYHDGKTDLVPKKQKPLPDDDLFQGIDDQIVIDYKKLRKAKNLPATKTAMDGVKREADKAGLSFADAIRLCCERGWAGFKAEWVLQPNRAATAMGIIGQATKLTGVQHGNFGAQDYRAGIAEDGSF